MFCPVVSEVEFREVGSNNTDGYTMNHILSTLLILISSTNCASFPRWRSWSAVLFICLFVTKLMILQILNQMKIQPNILFLPFILSLKQVLF